MWLSKNCTNEFIVNAIINCSAKLFILPNNSLLIIVVSYVDDDDYDDDLLAHDNNLILSRYFSTNASFAADAFQLAT